MGVEAPLAPIAARLDPRTRELRAIQPYELGTATLPIVPAKGQVEQHDIGAQEAGHWPGALAERRPDRGADQHDRRHQQMETEAAEQAVPVQHRIERRRPLGRRQATAAAGCRAATIGVHKAMSSDIARRRTTSETPGSAAHGADGGRRDDAAPSGDVFGALPP